MSVSNNIEKTIINETDMIRKRISEIYDQSTEVKLCRDILNYINHKSGKMIRSWLMINVAKMISGSNYKDREQQIIDLATSCEIIHNATILHDDVIDNNEVRRGMKVPNKVWDNTEIILLGDFLFATSFKLMADVGNIKSLKILANASKIISEGELIQLESKFHISDNINIINYLKIIKQKTAYLFATSCQIPAIIYEMDFIDKNLYNLGIQIGMLFQIIDDILDYGLTKIDIKKELFTDFNERKVTLPILLLLEKFKDAEVYDYFYYLNKSYSEIERNRILKRIIELIKDHNIGNHYCNIIKSYYVIIIKELEKMKSLVDFNVENYNKIINLIDYLIKKVI